MHNCHILLLGPQRKVLLTMKMKDIGGKCQYMPVCIQIHEKAKWCKHRLQRILVLPWNSWHQNTIGIIRDEIIKIIPTQQNLLAMYVLKQKNGCYQHRHSFKNRHRWKYWDFLPHGLYILGSDSILCTELWTIYNFDCTDAMAVAESINGCGVDSKAVHD